MTIMFTGPANTIRTTRYWPGMRLARDGAKVAISYQASADGANAAVEEIGGDGGHAIAVQADLTKSDDVQKLVRTTQEAFGQQIDMLIHVTGGLIARKSIEEMDEAHWQRVMDLNATSLFRMVKAVTPYMPDGGAIVAFASQAGRALLPTPPRKALS